VSDSSENTFLSARELAFLCLLILAAIGIRAAYLADWVRSPYFGFPLLDEEYVHNWAREFAQGQIRREPFFRAPLYSLFVAAVYRLWGDGPLAPRLFQMAFGAFSAVAVYFLGRRWLGAGAAGLAAALAAANPLLIFYDGELLSVSLETALNLAFLLALVAAWRERRLSRGMLGKWAAAGALLGAAALARPNILLPGGLLALAFLWRRRRAGEWRSAALACLAYGLAAAAAIAPAAVWNRVVGRDNVPICTQGGINLYLGNAPFASGLTPDTPITFSRHEGYEDSVELYGRRAAETALGRTLSPSEIDRYWLGRTFRSIASDPLRWLGLIGKKTLAFASALELRNNKSPAFAIAYSPWLAAWREWHNFAWLGPLALAGAALCWRAAVEGRILALFCGGYALSVILFFVCARFRAPLLPPLTLLAAGGASLALRGAFHEKRLRQAAAWAALACLGAALCRIDWLHLAPPPRRYDLWLVRSIHDRQGDQAAAEAALREALAERRDYPDGLHSLGALELARGNVAQAMELFRETIAADPRYVAAYNSLGACLRAQGRIAEARQAIEQCLALDPWHAKAWMNLGELELGAEDWGAAQRAFEKAEALNPAHFGGALGLARICDARGEAAAAQAWLSQALARDAESIALLARRDPAIAQLLRRYSPQ